jgi:hypothetical protein
VSGDSVTAGIQSALFDSANAGTRQATVTYSLSGNGAANYSLASDVLTAAITPKALTWATDSTAVSRAYDGTRNASVILGSLAGFVGTEQVTASVQSALYTSANAGTTSASVSYALADGANGGLASNYTLASNLVNGLITTKALSISGTSAASRQYDGTTTASITPGQLAGLVGNAPINLWMALDWRAITAWPTQPACKPQSPSACSRSVVAKPLSGAMTEQPMPR